MDPEQISHMHSLPPFYSTQSHTQKKRKKRKKKKTSIYTYVRLQYQDV